MYAPSNARTKTAPAVEYVQLAHNAWNPEKGFAQAEVIYSFGRRDQLDIEAIKRLVNSLCRFLSPEDALQLQAKPANMTLALCPQPAGRWRLSAQSAVGPAPYRQPA